jgi:hypothetical protein
MVVKIEKRTGLDDLETIAVWDEDEGWIEGDEPFMEDETFEGYEVEDMIREFDGPNLFASQASESPQDTIGGEQWE